MVVYAKKNFDRSLDIKSSWTTIIKLFMDQSEFFKKPHGDKVTLKHRVLRRLLPYQNSVQIARKMLEMLSLQLLVKSRN